MALHCGFKQQRVRNVNGFGLKLGVVSGNGCSFNCSLKVVDGELGRKGDVEFSD